MFHGRGTSARCFLEVAVGSVERSERATRSALEGASTFLKLTPMGSRRAATEEKALPAFPGAVDVIGAPGDPVLAV
jgi:hypothetical protein